MMSSNCTFRVHINNIVESAKKMSSWILRTFRTRDPTTMLTLYKTLVRPILEYSSVLWAPLAKGEIQRLEEIQQSFIRKIKGVSSTYSKALEELKLYSLERRRERYIIIQVWKMVEGLVPNLSNTPASSLQEESKKEQRRGRTLKVHQLAATPSHLQQIKQQSVKCFGVKLFNSLPTSIRNITNTKVDYFKSKLDQFLKTVEDKPLLRSGVHNGRNNNSNHLFDNNDSNNFEHTIHGVPNVYPPGEFLPRRRPTEELAISRT